MSSKDEVSVYYHDQDATWQRPGRGVVTRPEARFMKASGRGKFFDHGKKFRLNEETPTVPRDFYIPEETEAAIEGRNSCRRVGEYPDISYRVKHFSYPVPACVEPKIGAQIRFHVRSRGVLEEFIPAEILGRATGTSAQAQA